MAEQKREANQTPTKAFVLPYKITLGQDAVDLYEETGRKCQEWQSLLLFDILALNDDGLWMHTKFGYSIPRRNGKNEVVSIRELYGVMNGERILHTAHRTTTSSSAASRLARLLADLGYTEVSRPKKDEMYEKAYTYSKQFGLEKITVLGEGGGYCCFRTRTAKGGLGEGFDLMVIDEAQEYTGEQETSLKYVVTDSKNPQTIFCGTPPTAVSSGDVFVKMRNAALYGETENTGWAEWSVDDMTEPTDKDAWYLTNPSLGTIMTERSVKDEIGTDNIDFNIQRLGLWIKYNQRSEITEEEWNELKVDQLPKLRKDIHAAIKYGADGTNACLVIALKDADGKVFINGIDCRSRREGDVWLIQWLMNCKTLASVTIDGAPGEALAEHLVKEYGLKKSMVIRPTISEVILANADFLVSVEEHNILHMGQQSMVQSVTNCEKRPIGKNGGFGFRSTDDEIDVILLEAASLANWQAKNVKKKEKVQKVYY